MKPGRLRIYLGYASGVGKTYAMLDAARAAAARGRRVMIGPIDAHGSADMETLLAALAEQPLVEMRQTAAMPDRFDLQGALERKPDLVLVDQLAHANAPGAPHHKRWQDVADLLAAGIEVWGTLNIEEIESQSEVVAQITGAPVRDTVPDRVFDEAAEVELVDLPPEELLRRLRKARPQRAVRGERMATAPLKRESLVALRELAMRRVADRVGREAQVVRFGGTHAAERTSGQRLLACIDSSPRSAEVMWTARQMASAMHVDWEAVHVDTGAEKERDGGRWRGLARNIEIARRLGAETVALSGEDIAEEIVRYAHEHGVIRIVVGSDDVMPRLRFWKRGLAERMLRMSGDIDVHVVHKGDRKLPLSEPATSRREVVLNYVMGLGLLALATGVAIAFDSMGLTDANLVVTYLLAIVLVAAWWGRGPAIAASIVSVVLFNFFFTLPYYTLVVQDPQQVYTLGVMLAIALIVSELTSRMREQARIATDRERRTAALYRVSHALANATGRLQLVSVTQEQLGAILGGKVTVFMPEAGLLRPVLTHGVSGVESPGEMGVASWVFEHHRVAGRGTDTEETAQALYLPLVGLESTIGVLSWQPDDAAAVISPAHREFLEVVATQVALSLERDWLSRETQRILTEADAERARSSLLSVVSHDLRTPLAAIAGSASSLVEDTLDVQTRKELAGTIYEEADRLARLVDNLLQLTRIESGAMKVRKQWQPLEEVIGSSLRRIEGSLKKHDVHFDLAPDLPLVPMDGLLIEQVLVNLVENAAKYSDDYAPIDISSRSTPTGVEVSVCDLGPGLTAAECERVFEKYYRGTAGRSGERRGAGMGLAICRAIVTAHGGRIWAEAREGGGACFRFVLPVEGLPPAMEESTALLEEPNA